MEKTKAKMITVSELKNSYVCLPEELFTRKMSANMFGSNVLHILKHDGLNSGPVMMMGLAFFGGLSPVEIAVYGYLCFNAQADADEIAEKRKLTKKIVEAALEQLVEVGFVSMDAGERRLITLEEEGVAGAVDDSDRPESDEAQTAAAQPGESDAPKLPNE